MRRLALGVVLALALPASASAQGIDEFPLAPGADPTFITTGSDGRLWFPLNAAAQIGRIGTNGVLLPALASAPNPVDIAAAPEGAMVWSTPTTVQRREVSGVVSSRPVAAPQTAYAIAATPGKVWWTQNYQFTGIFQAALVMRNLPLATGTGGAAGLVPSTQTSPRATDVTVAPDGRLWTTIYEASTLVRVEADGYPPDLETDLAAGSLPYRITAGPDGAMWFTEYGANRIGRISDTGAITEFDLPRPGVGPNDIVAGPDGALWFTEYNDAGNAIGRITTDGKVIEYAIPTAGARAWGIAAGPDGKIWFTEYGTDKVGRLDPATAVPIGGGGGGPGGGPGADRTRPAFQGRVSISRKRFSVGRAPSGTQFRFALSEPGRVSVKIQRKVRGRRVRGKCRARARSGRRCTLWESAGRALTRQGLQGPNSIAFSGRLGRRALAAGSYRALITATDAAGNRSRTARLGFAIVPRRR